MRTDTSIVTRRVSGTGGGRRSTVPSAATAGRPGRRPARARATVPMAAAVSTEISPSVSRPRMSTRITLTTLRPSPSGSAEVDHRVGDGRRRLDRAGRQREEEHHPADGGCDADPDGSPGGVRGGLEAVGEATEDEDEQDGRQGLDGDLGERQVGCALDDEQPGHRVADHPEEEGAGEPSPDDRCGQRQPDEHRRDRHVDRHVDELRPARPPRAAEQQHTGHERCREQDHAEVDRERSRLGDGRDPVGAGVEAAQRGDVGVVGRRQARRGRVSRARRAWPT